MRARSIAEYEKYNPLRRPDWRFERIRQLADRMPHPGRCTVRDDDYIRRGRAFLLRWRNLPPEQRHALWREEPGLYYAYQLKEAAVEDETSLFLLESRILAAQPCAEIARETGTLPSTVAWYGKLWFDVADRLHQHDYILRHVLFPAARRAGQERKRDRTKSNDPYATVAIVDPLLDYSLKFFAYFGGPLLFEFALTGFQRGKRVATREEAADFCARRHADILAVRVAQGAGNFELTKFNIADIFAGHARLQELARKGDDDGSRTNAMEKSVSAFLQEFPWASGDDPAAGGTPLDEFDRMDAELRDDELLRVGAGEAFERDTEVRSLSLAGVPARRSEEPGGEDAFDQPR